MIAQIVRRVVRVEVRHRQPTVVPRLSSIQGGDQSVSILAGGYASEPLQRHHWDGRFEDKLRRDRLLTLSARRRSFHPDTFACSGSRGCRAVACDASNRRFILRGSPLPPPSWTPSSEASPGPCPAPHAERLCGDTSTAQSLARGSQYGGVSITRCESSASRWEHGEMHCRTVELTCLVRQLKKVRVNGVTKVIEVSKRDFTPDAAWSNGVAPDWRRYASADQHPAPSSRSLVKPEVENWRRRRRNLRRQTLDGPDTVGRHWDGGRRNSLTMFETWRERRHDNHTRVGSSLSCRRRFAAIVRKRCSSRSRRGRRRRRPTKE